MSRRTLAGMAPGLQLEGNAGSARWTWTCVCSVSISGPGRTAVLTLATAHRNFCDRLPAPPRAKGSEVNVVETATTTRAKSGLAFDRDRAVDVEP